MALQLTLTGDAGLEMAYWRITDIQCTFNGIGSDGASLPDVRFNLQGYKDSNYRAKGASAKSFMFYPVGSAVPSGTSVASNILQNTSGDLRPALYAWLKSKTECTSDQPPLGAYGADNVNVNWSNATDV